MTWRRTPFSTPTGDGDRTCAVIQLAIDMGKLICVADPDEAAARDAAFIAADDGGLTDIPPFPPIAQG